MAFQPPCCLPPFLQTSWEWLATLANYCLGLGLCPLGSNPESLYERRPLTF